MIDINCLNISNGIYNSDTFSTFMSWNFLHTVKHNTVVKMAAPLVKFYNEKRINVQNPMKFARL